MVTQRTEHMDLAEKIAGNFGPLEKVKPESVSTKWSFVEHAARSSRRSYLRLHWQSTDTLTALIDQENA
jgi:hypothetical protein